MPAQMIIEGGWNEDFTSQGGLDLFSILGGGTFYGRAEGKGSITLRNITIKPSPK
ncbi:hypothetical protein GF312_06245 [Candidatus Poribacteria bacterium]|nr:hypothetical protein [Candidatus Poribacteria bacterium]